MNIVKEHLYPTLDRLDQDMLIGSGFEKGNIKDLKKFIKLIQKQLNKKVKITGLKKQQLRELAKALWEEIHLAPHHS